MNDLPTDLDAVARDDALLDLLGSGAAPASDDPVARALFAWRSQLATGLGAPDASASPQDVRAAVRHREQPNNGAAINGVTVEAARINGAKLTSTTRINGTKLTSARINGTPINGVARRARLTDPGTAAQTTDDRPPTDSEQPQHTRPTTGNPRHKHRRMTAAAVAVGMITGFGGVVFAAADAEPGSLLWPVTRMVYADRAEAIQARVDAEAALDRARRAIDEGRTADAERYLDEAARKAEAADAKTAARLRDQVQAERERLATNPEEGPTPGGSPANPGHGEPGHHTPAQPDAPGQPDSPPGLTGEHPGQGQTKGKSFAGEGPPDKDVEATGNGNGQGNGNGNGQGRGTGKGDGNGKGKRKGKPADPEGQPHIATTQQASVRPVVPQRMNR